MRKRILALILLLALLITGLSVLLFGQHITALYRDLTFRWSDATETERKVKAYADQMGIRYGAYPESLIGLLERNPETEDFVLNYPFREEKDYDLSDTSRDSVPLFLQWDSRWGYEKYGSDMIAITGCGPTCLAMVGYYLTGDTNMSPDKVAKFAERSGYYEKGYGSSWKLISEGAQGLGLTATELPLVKSKMEDALENGSPIILAMGEGDFTSSGHYIVLTGVEDGAFRVNDPNSRINSEKLWTYEALEHQIRNIWAISKA